MAVETVDIELPSSGFLGYDSKVTIRNLTGADEKVIYSGANELAIDKMIKRCVVAPENFDVEKLCEQDKYFILVKIRVLTYGSDYKFMAKCPNCGKTCEMHCNLDELEVFKATKDLESQLSIVLPVCKDKLKLRILDSKALAEVSQRVARFNADRGTEYILRCAAIIDTINDETKSLIEKQAYVEGLNSRDINYIWNMFGKIKFGVNMTFGMTCPSCGAVSEVPVKMGTEFFRPVFDD